MKQQFLWLLKECVLEMNGQDSDSYMTAVKQFINIAVTSKDIDKNLFFSSHIDENRQLIEKYIYICNETISYCKKKNYSVDYEVFYNHIKDMSKWLHYSQTMFYLMKWLKYHN